MKTMKPMTKNNKQKLTVGVLIILVVFVVILGSYFKLGRAGITRFKKSWDSKMGDGVTRELLVYNDKGEEIIRRTGRFDFIQSESRISYIDADTGLQYDIITGRHSLILINELAEGEEQKKDVEKK